MTTLVLLPGMDGTGELFAPLLRTLTGSITTQVVAYPTRERLGYKELVKFVEQVLPAEDDYVLLGESFSGPIAIELAARRSSRLRGLILACTFASNPLPTLAPLRPLVGLLPSPRRITTPLTWILMGSDATPTLQNALATALASVEPAVLRHRAAAVLSVNTEACPSEIQCPILYLQAGQDRVVPARSAQHVHRRCPQTQIVRLEGPHLLLQTRPAEAATAIESFMSQLQPVS